MVYTIKIKRQVGLKKIKKHIFICYLSYRSRNYKRNYIVKSLWKMDIESVTYLVSDINIIFQKNSILPKIDWKIQYLLFLKEIHKLVLILLSIYSNYESKHWICSSLLFLLLVSKSNFINLISLSLYPITNINILNLI